MVVQASAVGRCPVRGQSGRQVGRRLTRSVPCRQEPIRWRLEEALTGGAAPEAGALPVLLLMPSLSSDQARSHYRHQLSSLLQHCRAPLSLHLVTPARHTLPLAQLLQELTDELADSAPGCRLRYTLLRGADQLAGMADDRLRGRRLLAVLRQLAPLGRVVFLDEQTLPAADLSPLLAELAALTEHQLAAGAPEDTARYLSRAQLEAAQLPAAGVSGRLLLLDLARLAAEPELGDAAELPATDAGLQPDLGGPLTELRRRRPQLVGLLPCHWTVTRPDEPPLLDALFACDRPPRVLSSAGRREADWEIEVFQRWEALRQRDARKA